jgi:sugar lactone lactonase YvrE
MAFDIRTGEVLHEHDFPSDTAGFGSFLNDFQVTSSGDTIFIADTGAPVPLIGGDPAIVVYNVKTKTARRVLEDHESVRATDKTLRVGAEDFSLMGMSLKIAVDSIALDRENQWLYYGAVNGEKLYRIRAEDLTDQTLSPERLASRIEVFADKTMSDGITTDLTGNIYLSDMENSAVHIIGQDRRLKTLIKDPAFRWPDGFSFGPDGWLYFTCSDLMNVVGKSASHIREHAPYRIFRFKPGGQGIPGH